MLHDGWNQSPRFLAPDLTTRQDLNGISNARENQDDEAGTGLIQGRLNCMGILPLEDRDKRNRLALGREASLTLSGNKIQVHI